MRLNEFEDLNLAINFHDELNPRLWDGDVLQPKVRKALLNIANHFKDFLGIDMFDLLDITISGSNAAFTYTPNSDIDLHLVVMIPEEHEAELKELFNAKKYQYNDQHNITVRGYNVELYVQDAEDAHHSMGIFSVSKNTWIKKPKKQRAQIDDIEVQEKYRGIKHRINQAIVSDNFDAVQKLWRSIKNMRQTGLEQGGEFSPENLAFKILRADGSLDKLSKHMGHLEDQGLSIDEEVETPPEKTKSEVYLDMDGVLADFFAEYAVLAGLPRGSSYRDIPPAKTDPTLNKMIGTDFFARLPKFHSADQLVSMVTKIFGHYNICSSPLRGDFENSEQQKTVWIREHLNPQPKQIIITPRKEKHATQPDGTPNVLIDDRGDNISKWEAAGGVGIKYQADEDGLDVITRGLKRALKIIAGEEHLEPQKLKSLDRSMPVAVGQDVEENMDHEKDGRAVEELRAALIAHKHKLQSASDDQVYNTIDRIMTRIARSHSISGQKLHDMWVDKYKQIPDTWVMNENFHDGKHPEDKGDSRRHGIPKHASLGSLDKIVHSKTASPRKKQLAHWQANMRRGRKK